MQERAIKNFGSADAEFGKKIRELIDTKYGKKKAAPAATPAPANPPPKAPANALSPDKKKSDSKVQLDPLT